VEEVGGKTEGFSLDVENLEDTKAMAGPADDQNNADDGPMEIDPQASPQ
jgi:hypothetical protein